MHPTRTRRARPARRHVAALVAAGALVVAGCGGDDPTDAATPTTAAPAGPDDLDEGMSLGCASLPPGQPMTAQQAVVRLSTDQICPGYVTVVLGTPVSFVNEAEGPVSVTVHVQASTGELGELLVDEVLEPGEFLEHDFAAAGLYGYSTDVVESFRGTVEVQPGR